MINEWILIVAMLSPGGNFMDKVPVSMPTKTACEQAIKTLPKKGEHPMGVQYRGVCVTQAHWLSARPVCLCACVSHRHTGRALSQ